MKKNIAITIISVLSVIAVAFCILFFSNNAKKTDAIAALTADVADRDASIEALTVDIADRDASIGALTADVADRDVSIEALTADVADRDASIEALTADVADRDASIEALTTDVADRDASIKALTADVADRDASIKALTADVAGRDESIKALTADVAGRDASIEALTADLADRDTSIVALTTDLADCNASIEALTADLADRDASIMALTADLADRDAAVAALTAETMNNTGDQYKNGYGVIQDYVIALDWYRQAAELGNAEAMKNVGNCYYDGNGVEQDYKKALEWYQKAADLGNTNAINNIGNCFYFGNGVERDSEKALELYQEAADLGNMAATANLADAYFYGDGVEQDYVKAHEYYVKAADMGFASANYDVACDYYYGYGVNQDYKEALEWYQKAADSGSAAAMYDIGNCYSNGIGVEQDYLEAFFWYHKAADQGNDKAMTNIGYLFDLGYGVKQNFETAMEWYQSAADLGNAVAMNNIGVLYRDGDGVEQNYEKAFEWYQKAADLGNATAMNNIGVLYRDGDGVEQDYTKALEWFQKAAENGNKKATENLEDLRATLCEMSDSLATGFGIAQGKGGDIVVQVEADETTIYSVEILKQNETPDIGSVAVEKLPDAIVAANTYDVDGVSGATVTSTAIREAVKNALESAGFDPEAYTTADTNEDSESLVISALGNNIEVGDIISFGSYEQDNDLTNGPESVEWIVLDIQDGKSLVISRYALDVQQYEATGPNVKELKNVTWESCTLRRWLNGQFYSELFTLDEQKRIIKTLINNGSEQGNPENSISGGNDTTDRIFLLSYAETEKYFQRDNDRICGATRYARANGAYTNGGSSCSWWLRSPGKSLKGASIVGINGSITSGYINAQSQAIRPAIWIELDPQWEKEDLNSLEDSTSKYVPGTYTAESNGMGKVVVTVTVDENGITAVEVDGSGETPGIGSVAVEKLPGTIVEANTYEVDGVAGATLTSTAIRNAVAAALEQAVSNAAPAEEAAPAAAEGEKVTVTGSGQGLGGTVEVQVVADATTIYSVEVVKQNETPGIGSVAVEKLPSAIVEANTFDVDSVSGATITSTAIRNAVKMALESAGFDPAAYVAGGAAPAAEEEPAQAEDQVYDVDVVVVGAGGAGMTAAITASDAGKNVLVLESQGMVGGNSVRSTGGMNAAPTEWQQTNEFGETAGVESTLKKVANYPDNARIQELGAVVAEQWAAYQENPDGYFDSAELFQLDTLIGGGGINDPSLVKRLVENSSDAIAWLEQLDPAIVLHNVAQFGGASVKRIHRPVDAEGRTLSVGAYVVPLLQQNLEARGIELLLNTTATEILMDNGKAVGVVAESTDGTKVTVNAGSVVIATGGFGANNEMIASIRPELNGFITTNAPGIQGQGIQMAQAVGADTVNLEQIQLHPTVHIQDTSGVLITEGLRGDGAILVNQEGERFFDEVSTRDKVSAAEFAQTGGYAWLIIDSRMSDVSKVIQGYINKGYAETGETYEALAEAIGAPADVFVATMEKWNACVEAKKDEDFGRVSFAKPLDQAPYYAIKVQPGIHHTMGGIKINDAAQVIDTEGNIIPGLFAAGEVTGGVHGNNRLGGNAVADFVIFGRIAGSSAAGILPIDTKVKEAAKNIYVPGTYTSEGTGMGKVVVKVTVDENGITAVEIDGSGETPGIGAAAIEPLTEQVLAAQSAQIDGVSGATLTSNAVRTAVESALNQAVVNEAQLEDLEKELRDHMYEFYDAGAEGTNEAGDTFYYAYDETDGERALLVIVSADKNHYNGWEGTNEFVDDHLVITDGDQEVPYIFGDFDKNDSFKITFLNDGDIAMMQFVDIDTLIDDVVAARMEFAY